MKNICVVGTGYVGLTTGTCFADMGNHVVCVDIDQAKVASLNAGSMPIHEPGLGEILVSNLKAGRLTFTSSYAEGLKDAHFVFIAVGTPDDGQGGADLSQVRSAAKSIGEHLDHPVIVVNKSTVPIGTGDLVTSIIDEYRRPEARITVVSNPEFLREGSALHDCMEPERVVLGSEDAVAMEAVEGIYAGLGAPVIKTDLRTAEMIKYASNAFLATRISFINEVAAICDKLGADVKQVALGMGYDSRIGPSYLDAGLGFGGSCFPKDVKALIRMARDSGQHPQMLEAVMEINRDRRRWVIDTLVLTLGTLKEKRVAMLGVAFKPNTDDVREAPALDLIQRLQNAGAHVRAYDPAAMENAAAATEGVDFASDAYSAADSADAVILVTEWNEFKNLDLVRLRRLVRRPVLIDGRNVYDPAAATEAGFEYHGVARGIPPRSLPVIESETRARG
ncbi:MAG TPA: UDP-glucose 6-dehydrogenase [Chloroflexi bacterium]|nr:UDP-glucose 6-dehydrogenase [Chloroflexota bacterium]